MQYYENNEYADASIPSADGRRFVVECVKGKSINFKVLPQLKSPKEEDRLVFDETCRGYNAIRSFAQSLKSMGSGAVLNQNSRIKNYMMCLTYKDCVEVVFINSKHDMSARDDVTVKLGYCTQGIERATKLLLQDVKKLSASEQLKLD